MKRLYSNSGLSNAQVRLTPGNRISVTDQNGLYQFSQIQPGLYQLNVFADGFSINTAEVNVTTNTEVNFALDSLPYFSDVTITTSHISHWFPPEDVYSLQFQATGIDGDGIGDISRVWYEIEDPIYTDSLQKLVPGSNVFLGQVIAQNLPVMTLHELIGKPFRFFIEDIPGYLNISSSQFISRIIDDTPLLISPTGLVTISSFPITFKWTAFNTIPFSFSLSIEIYSIDLGLQVGEINDIESTANELIYSTPLSNGDYYWVLYIVDEFGNRSSSKESSFRIQI